MALSLPEQDIIPYCAGSGESECPDNWDDEETESDNGKCMLIYMYSLLRLFRFHIVGSLCYYTDDSTLEEGLQVIEDHFEGVNCIIITLI